MKPFDYGTSTTDFLKNQELRAILRELPVQDRMKLLTKFEFRRAALEQPAEASGLPASVYEQFYEKELLEQHPDVVNGVAEAMQAVEICKTVLQTATESVSNDVSFSCDTSHIQFDQKRHASQSLTRAPMVFP